MHGIVESLYLRVLHGNLTSSLPAEASAIASELKRSNDALTDAQVAELLEWKDWRHKLCAGWFVALGRRAALIDRVGERLLRSETCFAGQGYCLALALCADEAGTRYLASYLSMYLPVGERDYDQEWAIGALTYRAPQVAETFADAALWASTRRKQNPAKAVEEFHGLVGWLTNHGLIASRDAI